MGAWGTVLGPVRHVNIRSTVTVTKKPASVKRHKALVVTATTKPGDARALITLQRYSKSDREWIGVDSGFTTKGGKITLRTSPSSTQTYRLDREGSGTALGSNSATFVVKVTKK